MDRDLVVSRIALTLSFLATCGLLALALHEGTLHPGYCIPGQCHPHYFGMPIVHAIYALAMVEFVAAGLFIAVVVRRIIAARRSTVSNLRAL